MTDGRFNGQPLNQDIHGRAMTERDTSAIYLTKAGSAA